MTTRLVVPTTVARQTATVNGHGYALDPNVFLDVPDADVSGLQSAGAVKIGLVGARKDRPDAATAGAGVIFVDLGYLASGSSADGLGRAGPDVLISDGAQWRDVLTGAGPGPIINL